jgi:hypothetical protein
MWTLVFRCEPEVSLSQEDNRQNGEACNLQIARPERFKRTRGGRVGARGRRLTGRPCDGRVLDITMSTPGEVNMNLRREVQHRHIRARARRLA